MSRHNNPTVHKYLNPKQLSLLVINDYIKENTTHLTAVKSTKSSKKLIPSPKQMSQQHRHFEMSIAESLFNFVCCKTALVNSFKKPFFFLNICCIPATMVEHQRKVTGFRIFAKEYAASFSTLTYRNQLPLENLLRVTLSLQ